MKTDPPWNWYEATDVGIKPVIRYANGVHLSAVLENTALVQGIRCETLGEHVIPWTCAVFSHTTQK